MVREDRIAWAIMAGIWLIGLGLYLKLLSLLAQSAAHWEDAKVVMLNQ